MGKGISRNKHIQNKVIENILVMKSVLIFALLIVAAYGREGHLRGTSSNFLAVCLVLFT